MASLPPLLRADGTEFDKDQVFLYTYRYTYAQRHADAGMPVDVLRELMDHRLLDTSKQYYRVGHQRRRSAVEKVTHLQFAAGTPACRRRTLRHRWKASYPASTFDRSG